MSNWLKNVEIKTTNGIKKSKDLKLRDYFEKQFPDLKRAREEKQNKAKAKADENGEIDSQQLDAEQEAEMKRMRSLAVIPPILLDDKLRKHKFVNNNGLILDPVNEHKELQVS